jgi:hypothetical protein
MTLPDRSMSTEARVYAAQLGNPSAPGRMARLQADIANRIGDAAWSAIHALGAHRWREGWETDLEKGWSRYRGSRCTICDEPWEGW